MATTTAALNRDSTEHSRAAWSVLAIRLGVGLLVLFIGLRAYDMADDYYGIALIPFLPEVHDLGGSDFPAFYGGAKLLFSDPSGAYDADTQARAVAIAKMRPPEQTSTWERYYNPPVYSLILAPLTIFEIHTAFFISLLLNAAGLGLLIGVLYRILEGRRLLFGFLVAGLVTSPPVNYAFWHAQPTLFLAASLGLVYLQKESGKAGWSGLAWAALIMKPHWLALPILGQLRLSRRQVAVAAAGVAVLALPFLFIGPHGTVEYVKLLLGRGEGDLGDESFSEAVLSWPGFFRGLTGEPRVMSALLMSAMTLIYYVAIRIRGREEVMPLAGAVIFVLVVPHSHPQDWIMLAPGMAFLLRSQRNPIELGITAFLFAALSMGIDNWSNIADRRFVTYWPTLVAFSLLIWLYILAWLPRVAEAPGARQLEPATATP